MVTQIKRFQQTKCKTILILVDGVYGGWGMLVSYYLPGNSLAAPPSHRDGGATANVEGQQGFLIPSHLSGGWEGQHSCLTPSHLNGGWVVNYSQ